MQDDLWTAFEATGEFSGAPVDHIDGFIHLSTGRQAAETAARHFEGQEGLMILAVETEALGDALRWEASRGGDLFPHYYGVLKREHVIWAKPLPLGNGGEHVFPDLDR